MRTDNKIDDFELKELLDNPRIGPRNHYVADCPLCGKHRHFYINRGTQKWDCKKCDESGNIIGLLSKLGKLFMLGEFKSIERSRVKLISELHDESDESDEKIETLETKSVKPPIGFKRVYSDEYLKSRKMTKSNMSKFKFGYTKLVPSLKNYVIFLIEESGECKGHLSRYTKQIPKGSKKIKYNNAKGVNFSHLLFGFDEISDKTESVIIVEGVFDKIALDNYLGLDNYPYIKCVATFGKKISNCQVLKLQSKDIGNIVIIYDEDAIREMKKYSVALENYFNVKVGFTYGKDINDSSKEEVMEIFNRLKIPSEFNKKVVKLL